MAEHQTAMRAALVDAGLVTEREGEEERRQALAEAQEAAKVAKHARRMAASRSSLEALETIMELEREVAELCIALAVEAGEVSEGRAAQWFGGMGRLAVRERRLEGIARGQTLVASVKRASPFSAN